MTTILIEKLNFTRLVLSVVANLGLEMYCMDVITVLTEWRVVRVEYTSSRTSTPSIIQFVAQIAIKEAVEIYEEKMNVLINESKLPIL
ncbi:hypothetical protein GLOIN_2v1476542 [Rhizophagus clarus]|uniref:Uncharacterized protein n=1 Tax=Rhizophagus clarus TaxID=94130 RepID=A0A8H3KRJ8_9GLOM|nr:hypothetical protein GLOIN_2v1476542 [Rhizophagus clarus]